jgi:hypothetical protein
MVEQEADLSEEQPASFGVLFPNLLVKEKSNNLIGFLHLFVGTMCFKLLCSTNTINCMDLRLACQAIDLN